MVTQKRCRFKSIMEKQFLAHPMQSSSELQIQWTSDIIYDAIVTTKIYNYFTFWDSLAMTTTATNAATIT